MANENEVKEVEGVAKRIELETRVAGSTRRIFRESKENSDNALPVAIAGLAIAGIAITGVEP